MKKEDYRAQVDAVPFSPHFQDRAMAKLMALAEEKERKPMKKVNLRTALIAAAVAAALSVTAYAAVTLLSPREVAQRAGNEALAAALEAPEAVAVNETKTVGDYNVTLMGLVSGEGLNQVKGLEEDLARDKTYAVLAYARTDGKAITEDVPDLTVSPLVEGYAPWQLNAWTLGGSVYSFAQEGVLYYLFECDNVEPFAHRTVYLAVYPGTHIPPNTDIFAISDEGHISVVTGAEAALFPLPLDQGRADPEKAAEMGFVLWTDILQEEPGQGDSGAVQFLPGDNVEEFQIITGEDDVIIAPVPTQAPQN